MGRDRDTSSDDEARIAAAKRPKAFQACIACRKSKVRCESIDGGPISVPATGSCRRCKLSKKPCSFSDTLPDVRPQLVNQPSSDSGMSSPQSADSPSNTKAFEDLARSISARLNIAPNPEESAWDMLQASDLDFWSVPIPALQVSVRSKSSVGRELGTYIRESLEDIVSVSQTQHLLDVYNSNYSPWLDLYDDSDQNHNPLLVLAKCAVASRHLDNSPPSNIELRIRRAADDAVLSHVFDPAPSLSAIHALLILSVWPSTQKLAYESVRDSRLLLASAISMARNRHLDQLVNDNEASGENGFGRRLWMSLTSFESILCLGTDRTPTSTISEITVKSNLTGSFATVSGIRATRLGILSRLLSTTRRGLAVRFADVSDVDRWYLEIAELLFEFKALKRLITPLFVVAKHERFHCQMLSIYHLSCRLLVLQHILLSAKSQLSAVGIWYKDIRYHGIDFMRDWGIQFLADAEAILVATCAISERSQLSSAPDSLFTLISLAAAVSFMAKAWYVRDEGRIIPGTSDDLILVTIERFSEAALHVEHAPAKYARLMQVWMKKWEEHMRSFGFLDESRGHVEGNFQAPVGMRPSRASLEMLSESEDFLRLMNPEAQLDDSFWMSFMDNLSTPDSCPSSTWLTTNI